MSVEDRDHGYKRIREALKRLKGSYTKVGVQQGSRHDDAHGVSDLVTIAAANEYGVRKADGTWRIPPRSFIASTFEVHKEGLFKQLAHEKDEILAGRKTEVQVLDEIGLLHTAQIVATIDSHPAPENAPSTIARKGSSGTLVNSGQLKQSIRHVNHLPKGGH